MTIKRFNQSGVGSTVQFGRRGGQVVWSNGAFDFTDAAGAAVNIRSSDLTGSISNVVTKNDLDRAVQGLNIKTSVQAKLTINDTTVTSLAEAQAWIQDNNNYNTYTTGQRILVDFEYNDGRSAANGIYEIDADGNAVRPADANTYATIEGAYMFVDGVGNTDETAIGEGTGWVLNVINDTLANTTQAYDPLADTPVTGTTVEIEVRQFHGAGTYAPGRGMAINGETILFDPTGTNAIPLMTDAGGDTAVNADQLLIVDLSENAPRRMAANEFLADIGIYADRTGSGNTRVTVAQDATNSGATITTSIELATTTHNPIVLSDAGYALDTNWTRATGVAPTVSLAAGDGTGANPGGNVSITAGAAASASTDAASLGGQIVLTPGAGGDGIADGYVNVAGEYGLRIPVSAAASAHDGVQGMIRVRRDTTNGVDNLEMWDSQLNGGSWVTVGGGATLSDIDGDTSIVIESTPGADEDSLVFTAATQEVLRMRQSLFTVTLDHGGPNQAGTGNLSGDITMSAGTRADSIGSGVGETAGGVTIETGALGTGDQAVDAGDMLLQSHGGDVTVRARASQAITGDLNLSAETINIFDIAGSATSTVNIGDANTLETNVAASEIALTSDLTTTITADTAFVVNAGENMTFTDTHTTGSTISFVGSTGGDSIFTVDAMAEITLDASAATTTETGIELLSPNATVALNADNGLSATLTNAAAFSFQRQAANSAGGNAQNITLGNLDDPESFFTVSANGDDSADNGFSNAEQYAENIRNASATERAAAIPNVSYIQNAVENAELGGIATRSLTIEDGQAGGTSGGTTFAFGTEVPANTRIRRVTVTVTEAFVGVTELQGTIANGGGETLFTNNDIDLATTGTYIIEHAGTATVSGALSLVFDADVENTATAGSVTVYVEFTI